MKWYEAYPDLTKFEIEGKPIPFPIFGKDCTMDEKDRQLIDWRIGHHVEAAGKMIAASIYALSKSIDAQNVRWDRIAAALERRVIIQEKEVDLLAEDRQRSERVAEKLLRDRYVPPSSEEPETHGPDWVQEVIEDDLSR